MKNKTLLYSMVVIIIAIGVVGGIVMPKFPQYTQLNITEQQDPVKHDFQSVLKYKNKYMGNAPNLSSLFRSLPLGGDGISLELFPETLTVQVNYKKDIESLDEKSIDKALIYNATAAFAMIDNLEAIDFKFNNTSYKVLRGDVEKWYGTKLSILTDTDTWKKDVQSKLIDNQYVLNCANSLLRNK